MQIPPVFYRTLLPFGAEAQKEERVEERRGRREREDEEEEEEMEAKEREKKYEMKAGFFSYTI